MKPFYYAAKSGRFFAFGTEIRPLLTLPEVSQEIRETKIADHMDVRLEDQVGTFYRDVFRLPGAHTLTVNPSGLGIARYWQLDRDKELRLASDEEYVDGYREHLTEAVRARTRTAFPIGSMLSGGLDSSSVACIGRNVLELEGRGPLHTFSAVFDVVQASDERPYIDAVLATGGFRPHFIDGDRKDPFSDLNQMLRRQEVPANAYNAFLFDELMQLANQSGVRVVLDGMGGDSTVSHGWRRLNDLAASFRWIVLARELRLFGSRLGKSRWQAYRDLIWASGLKPHAPLWLKRSVRRVVGRRSTPVAAPSTFVRATFSDEITRDRSPTRGEVFGPLDTSRELHFSQVATGELPAAMEVTDKIGGWLDLEFRYPFLDRRLVEYCLSLPADLKLRDGWTRYVARVAGTAYLPAEVQWRSDKGNLGYSFHHVLMTIGRSQVEEAIFARRDALDRYLDVDALQDALRRCASDEWIFDDAGTLCWLRCSAAGSRVQPVRLAEEPRVGCVDRRGTSVYTQSGCSECGLSSTSMSGTGDRLRRRGREIWTIPSLCRGTLRRTTTNRQDSSCSVR